MKNHLFVCFIKSHAILGDSKHIPVSYGILSCQYFPLVSFLVKIPVD